MTKPLKELCIDQIVEKDIHYSGDKLPTDLIEQIDNHPVQKLASLSPQQLCQAGCKNKEFALLILKTKSLYEKLGQYDAEQISSAHEKSKTGEADRTSEWFKLISGEFIVQLGKSDKEIAQYIIDTSELNKRISADQTKILEDFVNGAPSPTFQSFSCR
jgi:hypothetical protein